MTDQEILFGHVGRFTAQKNHVGLLKIFAAVRGRLPRARLVLLGGGEPAYIEKMQSLAAELRLEMCIRDRMDTVNNLQAQVQSISSWFSSLGSVFGR